MNAKWAKSLRASVEEWCCTVLEVGTSRTYNSMGGPRGRDHVANIHIVKHYIKLLLSSFAVYRMSEKSLYCTG